MKKVGIAKSAVCRLSAPLLVYMRAVPLRYLPEPEDFGGGGGSEIKDETWYYDKLTPQEKELFEEIASGFEMGPKD